MIQSIEIQTADGLCDAWLAQPNSKGPWPGVIFSMDAVGPRSTLKDMAERLASSGYVVLLPNLFYRMKHAPIVSGVNFPAQVADLPKILEQIMPLVESFDSQKGLEDMGVFTEFLAKQPQVRSGKLGIFGYCMGGAMAIRTAARYPEKFAAVASFHAGGLVSDDQNSPHRLLPTIQASLYVGHADQDPHMNSDQIQVFDRAVAAMAAPHKTELYTGAHHHFTMVDLPAYNADAAERHWKRLLQLLKDNL